ncbi:hypothetical protein V9T40_007373 [Parthenolecanium corni]|uniref:Uncharacterized protein n=1 Tax=Parthenolecanium corni TaxID=536013 RepID=A0AAN9TYJ1_9HEMI
MIHRSSSSRRRKSSRSTASLPQSSSTNSLARKQSAAAAFESGCSPSDDKEAADREEKREASAMYRIRSGGGGGAASGASSTSTLDEYGSGSSGRSSSITVTATDEYNTNVAMFSMAGGGDSLHHMEAAISLSEYSAPSCAPKTRSSASAAAAAAATLAAAYESARSGGRSVVTPDEGYSLRSLQASGGADTMGRKSRSGLLSEAPSSRSPRSSLVPEDAYNRGSRGSIDPSVFNRGSRNSLLPDPELYNRSSRPSMVADVTALRSSRSSLMADLSPNRSPRNSLVPADLTGTRSGVNMPSAGSAAPLMSSAEGGRAASRCSLVPESAASGRSPRNSLVPESGSSRTPRGSLVAEPLALPACRTPRGSVTSEGSMYSYNRSSRSSLPLQDGTAITLGKSPRGSIASATGVQFDLSTKTPRGSVESVPPGINRITSQAHRSISPFHSGSLRGNQSATSHLQNDNTNESRRASSNVSQVSADDRRHLCEHTKLNPEAGLRLTAYGSFVYQLNHANMESSGAWDFVLRALTIVYRTVIVTVLLGCITLLPLIMLIMGSKFMRDCPKEPHIAVYMVVGGCFGLMKMLWVVWGQIKSLRYERLNPPDSGRAESDDVLATSVGTKIGCFALTAFLVVWFLFGNYWIWHIYWPDHEPTLYKPDNWCHRTLYVFAIVHLVILYSILFVVLLFVVVMATIQICLLRCKLKEIAFLVGAGCRMASWMLVRYSWTETSPECIQILPKIKARFLSVRRASVPRKYNSNCWEVCVALRIVDVK